jgi:hypothetical protein
LKRWRSKHRKVLQIIHEFAWVYNNVLYSCNLLRILKLVKYVVRCLEFLLLICLLLISFFWFLFRMWAPDCLIWSLCISGPDVRWTCDEYFSQALLTPPALKILTGECDFLPKICLYITLCLERTQDWMISTCMESAKHEGKIVEQIYGG